MTNYFFWLQMILGIIIGFILGLSVLFILNNEQIMVLKQLVTNTGQSGMFLPSSQYLGRAMAKQIKGDNILLIGMGCGSILQELQKTKKQITAIEIDPQYFQHCQQKFKDCKNVQLYNMDIVDFQPKTEFDCVFSTIPHSLIKDDQQLQKILLKYNQLTKDKFTHFQYCMPFNNNDFIETNFFKRGFKKSREFVPLNIPPTFVNVYTLNKQSHQIY